MDDSDSQELFLLEFLVDRVNIPSVQAVHESALLVKTCIEFKILNLPPIYISQDSPDDKCSCLGEDVQVFRKGKSCLFALPERVLKKPICSFPVIMTVYKKLPPNVLPDVMTIGCCQIEINDMLNALLEECLQMTINPCRTLKNNFRISTATGQCVGEVTLFLRFSRFGPKVVTQFQTPHDKKPYLFKGPGNSPVFQCRRLPSVPEEDPSCACPKIDCKSADSEPRSCCKTEPHTRRRHRSKTARKGGKATRPCCSHKEQPKSQSQNCYNENQSIYTQGEKKTRRCGCEIKEDKFACGKK